MLTDTDAEIIGWTRQQILADQELADLMPDGPWQVDTESRAIISAETRTAQPTGFPQSIRPPVPPGMVADAVPPIADTFDPPAAEPFTAPYLCRFADPLVVRAVTDGQLAMLAELHRLLASDLTDEAGRDLAARFLRLLAAVYRQRPGYQAAIWTLPGPAPRGARPVTQADVDRLWPDAIPASRLARPGD